MLNTWAAAGAEAEAETVECTFRFSMNNLKVERERVCSTLIIIVYYYALLSSVLGDGVQLQLQPNVLSYAE